MRLDKFISQQLEISRAIAGREIRARKITVNGEVERDSAYKVLPDDEIAYDGNPLVQQQGPRYFMLNKPQGYVCSTDDPDHPTVLYFIEEPAAWKLHAAGRLDIDTTGLVLLTDDGQWSHRITSPRHHLAKTYLVEVEAPLEPALVDKFAAGILLHNARTLTKPAVLEILGEKAARLTISEGRYHQVKRMFAAMGNHVVALHRESIGDIILDEQLGEGEYRALTAPEVESIGLPAELKQRK